jgi:hypothetical protein
MTNCFFCGATCDDDDLICLDAHLLKEPVASLLAHAMPKGFKQGRYCFVSCRRCIALSENQDQWKVMHGAIMAVALTIAVSNYQKGDHRFLTNDAEFKGASEAVAAVYKNQNFDSVLARLREIPEGQHDTGE